MLSVILSTRDDAETLPEALSSLVPAAVDGLICEVIVADGASTDATLTIADAMGATVLRETGGHAARLNAAAAAARCPWLLVLPANARLKSGFELEIARFVNREGDAVGVLPSTHESGGLVRATDRALRQAIDALFNQVGLVDPLLVKRARVANHGGFASAGPDGARLSLRGTRCRALDTGAILIATSSLRPQIGQSPLLWLPRAVRKSAAQTSAKEVTY